MKLHSHIVFLVTLAFMSICIGSMVNAEEPLYTFPPMQEALDALESDQSVTVQMLEVEGWEEGSNYYYAFEPTGTSPETGFIFYPGGLVDPRSYAPFARAIAAKGFLTIIVKMPDDLAIQAFDRATDVIGDYEEIEAWALGGHSLGGVSSCAYAQNNSEKVDGVVLWASYPSGVYRIDDKDLAVISIYGTKDGLATVEEDIEPSREHLPPDTQFEPIEGGNHTQFGWYDTSPDPLQPGDNEADITRKQQQDQVVEATSDFLAQFVEPAPPTCPLVLLYGEDSDEVELLRNFRDTTLTRTTQGQELIELYYELSPLLEKSILEDEALKIEVKGMVDSVLPLIKEVEK